MSRTSWTRVAAAVVLALPVAAAAQVSFEAIPAAAALRGVLAAPAAAGALARSPGLALVPTLSLASPIDLRALTPLLARLPADFAPAAAWAASSPDPAAMSALAAEVEAAYAAAAPAVAAEIDARAGELRTMEPGRDAAQAWRALAAETAPLALYGPGAARGVDAVRRAAQAAEDSAFALARAEELAKSLGRDPAAELERAADESGRWADFADHVDAAGRSVHAVNAPAGAAESLALARARGVHVAAVDRIDGSPTRVVIDNRLLVDFDAHGRESSRRAAGAGWFLADGAFVSRDETPFFIDSARAFIQNLPEDARRGVEAELMTNGVVRFGKFLAAATLGSLILLHYAPVVVLPLLLWGSMSFLARYADRRRRDEMTLAARLGWTTGLSPAPPATAPWERILGDASWEPARPYHLRLDAAIQSLDQAAPPAEEFARLLARLGGPVWSPYLREAHLGFVWRQIASSDPLVAALAAQFLAGASAYFLGAYLEERPAERAALEAYERLAPQAARSLRAALAERAAL